MAINKWQEASPQQKHDVPEREGLATLSPCPSSQSTLISSKHKGLSQFHVEGMEEQLWSKCCCTVWSQGMGAPRQNAPTWYNLMI